MPHYCIPSFLTTPCRWSRLSASSSKTGQPCQSRRSLRKTCSTSPQAAPLQGRVMSDSCGSPWRSNNENRSEARHYPCPLLLRHHTKKNLIKQNNYTKVEYKKNVPCLQDLFVASPFLHVLQRSLWSYPSPLAHLITTGETLWLQHYLILCK